MKQALVVVEIEYDFPPLDTKADSKIVQLDLLWVAVVFLFFTFYFKSAAIFFSTDHKASIINYL